MAQRKPRAGPGSPRQWIQFALQSGTAEIARRLWKQIDKDNILGRAAELAFFFLFSIFPLLIVLTSLLRFVPNGARVRTDLLHYFGTALPPSAYRLVVKTLHEVTTTSGRGSVSIGIIVTLASASAGMVAVIEGLNTAYAVREARPWLRRRGIAILLTLALVSFTACGMTLFLYGNQLASFIAANVGFEGLFDDAWPFVQWPLVVLFLVLALALTYRFAPNVRVQRWKTVIPGAIVAFLVWLLASIGLKLYLRFFNTYSMFYGSLGAVMILMVWFYLFGAAILIGGEVNAVLENAAAEAGDPESKLSGHKAPGG
jgi:membrane protein